MRFSQIYTILQDIEEKDYALIMNNHTLNNLNKFKSLIEFLEKNELSFYNEEISFLKSSKIYSTTQDLIDIYDDSKIQILRASQYLINSISSLKLSLSKLLPESKENELSIKFPKPDSFENLIKDMTKIEKQLSVIVNDKDINSTIQVSKWEHGSYWIDIIIGSMVAVNIIGLITWAAAYIASQINKNKENSLYLQKIGTEVEMLKSIREKQEVYLNELIDNEIHNIQEKFFNNNENNERNKKIKDTIKLFSSIIQRGGEFKPSLISPKEIKDSFPDFKNIKHIKSKIEQIPEKIETQETSNEV